MKLPILPFAAVLAALVSARAEGASTTDFAKTFTVAVPAGLADDTAFLDLEGNTLTVDCFFFPVDDGEGGLKLRSLGTGTHSAAAVAALGADVADTSAGATGRIVVRARETIMILR